jgi:hypothetical protein
MRAEVSIMSGLLKALAGGFVGAAALTALHESLRRLRGDAPRMDVLGERAIARGLGAAGIDPPPPEALHGPALAGDLAANTLYYGLIGLGPREWTLARGAALGLLAGVGAVALPGPMGLGSAPSNRTPATRAMTVGLYLAGGLVAAAVMQALDGGDR